MPLPPTAQVTVTLSPTMYGWLDTTRDGPPILVVETGGLELCLVLPADQVTVEQAGAARRLAELVATFAHQVAARSTRRGPDTT